MTVLAAARCLRAGRALAVLAVLAVPAGCGCDRGRTVGEGEPRRPPAVHARRTALAATAADTSVHPSLGFGEADGSGTARANSGMNGAAIALAALALFECNRCHELPDLPPPPHARACVQCHREIRAGTFDAAPDALARWRPRLRLLAAPSLAAAGTRLRRAWIARYLQAPSDVRPQLAPTMPRLAISAQVAERLAAYLVPSEQLELDLAGSHPERGAQLYVELRCARCHRFTGAALPAAHAGPAELGVPATLLNPGASTPEPQTVALADAIALAPDLAFARERMQPGRLLAWLRDPRALAPEALMPPHALSEAGARDLAAFLLQARLQASTPAAPFQRLPPLARAVHWDDVDTSVFGKVCRHCHAAPHFARGDGGPGNTGGFGFAARGLDLSSYEGISSSSVGDDGERRSVFAPLPDGTPRLLAHLLARTGEDRGTTTPGVRGMPLGFPPLAPQDVQLVETWIAQGHPL